LILILAPGHNTQKKPSHDPFNRRKKKKRNEKRNKMKKMNKKGFTLVEIMIVVAIIGLLAAIGIPSIMNAYNTSKEKTASRNVTEIEKAKGVLTLPSGTIDGAVGLTKDDTFDFSSLAKALRLDATDEAGIKDALKIDGKTLVIGDLTTKASYSTP
jgi:prepilin-type N-terminal cleavage/methylation domain-containing protein